METGVHCRTRGVKYCYKSTMWYQGSKHSYGNAGLCQVDKHGDRGTVCNQGAAHEDVSTV